MYTFNQMLDLCWKEALDNTALAKLYEATSEYGIDRVYTVFRGPNNTTIMVNCNTNGEMVGPATVDSPWMEDEVIHPPIHMEEEHANQSQVPLETTDSPHEVEEAKGLPFMDDHCISHNNLNIKKFSPIMVHLVLC